MPFGCTIAFRLLPVALWLCAVGVVAVGCSQSPDAGRGDTAWADRPLQVEIHVENVVDVEISSIQLDVEFDSDELEMHRQLTSLLPESMRLEYNAEHFRRGRFRMLCVPTLEPDEARVEADEAPAAAIRESFPIARMQFSSRQPGERPRLDAVEVTAYRVYGPLPDQPDVTGAVRLWLREAAPAR